MNAISKAAATNAAPPERDRIGGQKTAASKFDRIRAELLQRPPEAPVLPAAVTQVPPTQLQELRNLLSNSSSAPGQALSVDLESTRASLRQLGKRVNALPKTQALDPVRDRFISLEQQYDSASRLLPKIGDSNDPKDYLQLQMQMYLLAENIALV